MYPSAVYLVLLSLAYSVAGGPQLLPLTSGTTTSGSGRVVGSSGSSGSGSFVLGSGSASSGSGSGSRGGSSGSQFSGSSGGGSSFVTSGSGAGSGSGGSAGSSGFGSGSGSVSGSNLDSGFFSGGVTGAAFGSSTSSGFIQNVGGSVSGGSGTQFVNRGPQVIVNAGQTGVSSQDGFFAEFLQQLTITVTETRTIDNFVTVTETILNSVPITLTGFNVNTVTLTTYGVFQTEVDDVVAVTTTVVERPVTEFVTTAKSNFIYVTEVSVDVYTITHNAHLISQTVHTTFVTQTLTLSSPVVRTFLTTATQVFTDIRTVVNTVFAYGY